MDKLKIVTVIGTRPEIIRLSRVIAKLDENCSHILIHTGQNYDYELNEIFFKDLDIREPDYFLNASGKTPAETIGKIIISIDSLLEEIKPEALLILGDTNSSLSVLPAKRRQIPTFHMEAGNRCFDMRVPEEINRRIVDHISDINLPYSDIARNYLISEGLSPDRIIKTGSPMSEVIYHYKTKIEKSDILERIDIKRHEYFVVSAHREENIESNSNFSKFIQMLNELSESYQVPIILSTHPRTKKRLDDNKVQLNHHVRLMKPLCFSDYNKLQMNASAVLSDSGTINEEASILNFPALNIRETNERPEAMEEGSTIMAGLNIERIFQGLEIILKQKRGKTRTLNLVDDYSTINVSEKVLRVIHSYVDYAKLTVWKNT